MDASRQLSLLDLPAHMRPARVRRSDPVSSSVAIDKLEASGALGRQAAAALALVRRYPGRTSKELAGCGVLERHAVARRLADLFRDGLVRRDELPGGCRWYAEVGR